VIARAKGPINHEKLKQRYRRLLDATGPHGEGVPGNRDRGQPRGCTPPTPPDVRVRKRGMSFSEVAGFLRRTEDEVREKAKELRTSR
jgi:hypothetical protein